MVKKNRILSFLHREFHKSNISAIYFKVHEACDIKYNFIPLRLL